MNVLRDRLRRQTKSPLSPQGAHRRSALPTVAFLAAVFVLSSLQVAFCQDTELANLRRLRLTGHYAEAHAQCDELASKAPLTVAREQARSWQETGRREAAIRHLEQVLKSNAKAPAAERARIAALLAELYFSAGDYPHCQQYHDEALALDAQNLAAHWWQAEWHRMHGRLDEAAKGYEWFVDYYNEHDEFSGPEDLHWIGLAAAQFARWKRNSGQFRFLVNDLYPDARRMDPDFWPAHLESGRLFLEKFNQPEARVDLDKGLAIHPDSAELHALSAELALVDYQVDRAEQAAKRSLKTNPQCDHAYRMLADAALIRQQYDTALDALQAAVEINPLDPRTLGRLAAVYGAIDGINVTQPPERMAQTIATAEALNPRSGEFYLALATTLDLVRKYPQAAHYYTVAVERMPELSQVRGQLGLMQMRLGNEAEAAQLLEDSFRIDPFNVRVRNMLQVLDVLSNYAVVETEHFIVRFDRGRDEILAECVTTHLEETVYPTIVARLGYEPREKSLFEIFNRANRTSGHGWFSARMVGLPFVGTVAACGGEMVAMVSPTEMPGQFNWAEVLQHEFVHVVNLQQTHFNIPHWYTEALAVRLEDNPRPREWELLLARRIDSDTLFNLDTINMGFLRPGSGDDWTLAYCQAELYAEYMVATYGEPSLRKLLDAFADNHTMKQALRECFDVSPAEFEAGYRDYVHNVVRAIVREDAWQRKPFAELKTLASQEDADVDGWAELAVRHLERKEFDEARQWAERTLRSQDDHVVAHYVLAQLAVDDEDVPAAIRRLEARLDSDAIDERTLRLLGELYVKAERVDETVRIYELAAARFPHRTEWFKALAKIHLQQSDDDRLAVALERLAELEPYHVVYRKKLAQLACDRQDWAEAQRWALAAIHVAYDDALAHALLGQAHANRHDPARAVRSYDLALRLDSSQNDWRWQLAQAARDAGLNDRALAELEKVLAADPEHREAQALLRQLAP